MIRVFLIALAAGILGLLVQSTLVHSAFPAAIAPDFLLVLVVLLALWRRTVGSVVLAFLLGILADFASGQFIGLNAAGMLVVFGLVGLISSRVYAERGLAIAFITFFCSLAKSVVILLMFWIYVRTEILMPEVGRVVLLEAFFSALSAPVVLTLIHWSNHSSRGPSRKNAKSKASRAKGSVRGMSNAR